MNIKYFLLFIAFVSISCSSAKDGAGEKAEIVIEDGYITSAKDELMIEDKDLKHIQDAVVTNKESSAVGNFIASDGTKVSISVDGYGNKSETRYFDDDAKIQMVLVKTSRDGKKQVYIYGQNGEVKDLPANMIDKAMTLTPSQIASAAGFYEGRRETDATPAFSASSTQTTVASLQPLPVYTAPAENSPVPQQQQQQQTSNENREETLARPAEPTEKKDSSDNSEPTRVTENLQNYLPKKRKDVITDNN